MASAAYGNIWKRSMCFPYPNSSPIVPSRSRKTARRSGCVSDILGTPNRMIVSRIFELYRGGEDGIHRNPLHAAVIHRAAAQKTGAARNSLANQRELVRHGSRSLRIGRPKNSNRRKARSGGHVHGA